MPVIGLLSQNSDISYYDDPNKSYVFTTYVNFLQSQGAQVVPILFDSDEQTLNNIFQKVNGIFIPGGGTTLKQFNQTTQKNVYLIYFKESTQFLKTVTYLVQLAKNANDNGVYFPIWGTCLGFQSMGMALLGDIESLDTNIFNDENFQHRIELVNINQSRVFGSMNQNMIQWFQKDAYVHYYHHDGFLKDKFLQNQVFQYNYQKVQEELIVTGFSTNNYNMTFIASYEHKKYPFYGVQFHPEKNIFNFRLSNFYQLKATVANHDSKTVKGMQALSEFFVNEARKNFNFFTNEQDLKKNLIYQNEFYTKVYDDGVVNMYLFPYQQQLQ